MTTLPSWPAAHHAQPLNCDATQKPGADILVDEELVKNHQ
jgi:hypothetical protein